MSTTAIGRDRHRKFTKVSVRRRGDDGKIRVIEPGSEDSWCGSQNSPAPCLLRVLPPFQQRYERPTRRTGVFRRRANDPVVALLLEHVGRPARDPRTNE